MRTFSLRLSALLARVRWWRARRFPPPTCPPARPTPTRCSRRRRCGTRRRTSSTSRTPTPCTHRCRHARGDRARPGREQADDLPLRAGHRPLVCPGKFPRTEALFKEVEAEAKTVVDDSKKFFQRPRPYHVAPERFPHSIEHEDPTHYSYPSGHSTRGTIFAALLLAELFPDRAPKPSSRRAARLAGCASKAGCIIRRISPPAACSGRSWRVISCAARNSRPTSRRRRPNSPPRRNRRAAGYGLTGGAGGSGFFLSAPKVTSLVASATVPSTRRRSRLGRPPCP